MKRARVTSIIGGLSVLFATTFVSAANPATFSTTTSGSGPLTAIQGSGFASGNWRATQSSTNPSSRINVTSGNSAFGGSAQIFCGGSWVTTVRNYPSFRPVSLIASCSGIGSASSFAGTLFVNQ
jgi:hypothetical protein